MSRSKTPPHLPTLPSDRDAYEQLYDLMPGGCDFDMIEDWKEKRIPVGLSGPEVYCRLPSAPDFEYGGYLTKTRIRFVRGSATEAPTDKDKPCIFHSHPTNHPYADVPSPSDIYAFLKWPHLRAITVGAKWIWVWDKNQRVLATVKRLLKWEGKHLVREMRRLCEERPEGVFDRYFVQALKSIGIDCPTGSETDPERWCRPLDRCTGINTLLIPRESSTVC